MLGYGNRDSANEVAVRNTPGFGTGASGYADYPAGHVEGFPDTFKMLFRSVYSAAASPGKAKPLFAGAEDGHQEVAVCEAIMHSNKEQRWVKVQR